MNEILNKIINKEINVSNLLKFLNDCKKFIIKINLILKYEKNDNNLKNSIIGCQKIYNYIIALNNSPIYKTEFNSHIRKYIEEFENYLSQFSCFKTETNKNKLDKKSLTFIKQCSLPKDNTKEIYNEEKKEKKNKNLKDLPMDKNLSINKDNINIFDKTKFRTYKAEKSLNENIKKKDTENVNKEKIKIFVKEDMINDLIVNYPNTKQLKEKLTLENNILDINNNNRTEIDVNNLIKNQENPCSITWIFDKYMQIINQKNQKFSLISNEIRDVLVPFDNSNIKENNDFIKSYNSASFLFQNLISNIIRENIITFDQKNLESKTLEKSYIDITIEITEIMNLEQRISSLIISTALAVTLSKYGCNVRISVFAERECCWVLSNEFTNKNIDLQLSRLRDVLSAIKRLQSFPADALKMLKNSFERTYNGKDIKYIQVLISNLISPQVLDKNLDWNELGQRIIVFGIKSNFEDEIYNKYPAIYKKELLIPTSKPEQIIQEFFSFDDIQTNSKHFLENSTHLIYTIINDLKEKKIEKNFCLKRALINPQITIDNNNLDNIIEKLIDFIKINQIDTTYFSQNISANSCKLSDYISYETKIEKQFSKENEFEELEKLSSRKYVNNMMNESILTMSDAYLNKFFKNYLIDNVPTKKIPCSSGGSISIPRFIKFFCSGFSDPKIFEKLLGGKKKKYSIIYILDLSESVLLDCNYSHTITIILMLILAPTILDNVQQILIDIIINTKEGIKVVDFNSNSDIIKSSSKIEEILYLIQNELSFSCNPGSCLNAAYNLLQEKRNSIKLFLITDGYINSEFEIKHALSLIYKLENENIDLITIGVGSFPKRINYIFPVCCYSPQIQNFQDCLISCLEPSYNIDEIKSISLNNSFTDYQILQDIIKKRNWMKN